MTVFRTLIHLKSLAGEVEIARAKENQLQSDLTRLETKAGSELKDTVQLRQLQREADANRTLYESFLARFKQTSEQQEMQQGLTQNAAKTQSTPCSLRHGVRRWAARPAPKPRQVYLKRPTA